MKWPPWRKGERTTHSNEDYTRMHVALPICCTSLCKGVNDDDRKNGYEGMHIIRL